MSGLTENRVPALYAKPYEVDKNIANQLIEPEMVVSFESTGGKTMRVLAMVNAIRCLTVTMIGQLKRSY